MEAGHDFGARRTHGAVACAVLLGALLRGSAPGWAAGPSPTRRTVCVISFNGPEEVSVFRSLLPEDEFEFVDLAPAAGPASAKAETVASTSQASAEDGRAPWIFDACRPDVQCDVAIYAAEFAGRFFGKQPFSLGLQEMEEASCQARCGGLFHHPQEVFLLACNTLATKDQDSRTPEQYLRVLLDHGFDHASAERVVELRYGPLGPSFREALRRIFAGVPRLYGFRSVAPRGEYTAPLLARYLRGHGDYAEYLNQATGRTDPNVGLLHAFENTALTQAPGLRPFEAGEGDRDALCALYDERTSVRDRLRIARDLMSQENFLAFVPTVKVFLGRHEPARFDAGSRELFREIQALEVPRERVLGLVHDLDVSVLKLELAYFALQMEWITPDELRRTAIDGAKQLLSRPLTSEAVDIMCEITKREPLSNAFGSNDLSPRLFEVDEGVRLVDCLHPADPDVTVRLVAALDRPDPSLRLWAAYALSRRLPLDDQTLMRLATYLDDPLPDLRERVAWTLRAQGRVSEHVMGVVQARDPRLAAELRRA